MKHVDPLPPDYLRQCEQDARRFSGAWTGTSGTLAAHVMRLLDERKRILVQLEEKKDTHGYYR
jgi:hypothetical protein